MIKTGWFRIGVAVVEWIGGSKARVDEITGVDEDCWEAFGLKIGEFLVA